MKNAISGPPFETHYCDDLFKAVLDHDLVDLDAELPGPIHLDYSQDEIIQGYRLSLQLWGDGVAQHIVFLRGYIKKVSQFKAISPEDQLAYKDIRAKMKHMRCACAIFDSRHRYPKHFNKLIITMGRLQDRIKNDLDTGKKWYAWRFRFYLSKLPYSWITKEIDDFQPSTPQVFQAYMRREIGHLKEAVAQEKITNREFHELRKVISRQVAFYDCMKVLYPSDYHRDVSRYLGTVYTLMGRVHDGIVLKNLSDTEDFYEKLIELPPEIKIRLAEFSSSRA